MDPLNNNVTSSVFGSGPILIMHRYYDSSAWFFLSDQFRRTQHSFGRRKCQKKWLLMSKEDDNLMMSATCMCLSDSIKCCFCGRRRCFVIQMPQRIAKHSFRYCFHQATRPEELVAMFHAANDTIGIDKVRKNETTAAPNILTSFQRMSTYI